MKYGLENKLNGLLDIHDWENATEKSTRNGSTALSRVNGHGQGHLRYDWYSGIAAGSWSESFL